LEDLYEQQFISKSVNECAFIFDKVIQETSSVTLDSFWRFEETHTFQEWVTAKYPQH